MQLRIYFRHLQYRDATGQAKIYRVRAGMPAIPQNLELVNGNVPQPKWIDMTDHVEGLEQLKLTWTQQRNEEGEPALNGAYQLKRAASGAITISGTAYEFVKDWCEDQLAAALNAVDVKIEDTSCDITYTGWSIHSTDIQSCEDENCTYEVTLKQKEDPYHCIQQTLISDNHQGWFQPRPTDNKLHPRFTYCNEIRPNGMLIVIWYLLSIMASIVMSTLLIVVILTGNIGALIRKILKLVGVRKMPKWLQLLIPPGSDTIKSVKEKLKVMFLEAAGCGREHPAPLIRDYIQNACDKCGVKVDDITCPIFFSPSLKSPSGDFLDASSGIKRGTNPHYNACYLYAPYEKGIRRYSGIDFLLGDADENTTTHYQYNNRPVKALSDFLNELKDIYNADWYIKYVNGDPHLYFWRKDWFYRQPAVYDFRKDKPDRNKILQGICFEWNEVKYPSYATGLYAQDAQDMAGNEAVSQMGGVAGFALEEANNKLFEGALNKETQHFGATKFRLDGAGTDYLYDAMQQLVNSQVLNVQMVPQMRTINNWLREYANYGLLLKDDTCSLPKILIWDGASRLHARAIRDKVPMSTDLHTGPVPIPNTRYNVNHEAWSTIHEVHTHVKGNKISFANPSDGVYDILELFGSFTKAEARLVNYPMYFDPKFEDTLWDWYHWIDDPRANPKINKNWSVKITQCCSDIKKLGLTEDAISARLGETVKLPLKNYENGIITEIEMSYQPTDVNGQYIQLKGTV